LTRKQRLELTWIGKDERPRLEPRILIEDPSKSHHAAAKRDGDFFDNMLIHGDNLLALKALEADYAGKVKCIYIDPPYNTGSAFEHYDDGVEHSLWLSLLRDRLEILKRLMTSDGLLFVQIDDNEVAYLTILMDEIFGRPNRINIIAVKMSEATGVKMTHASKRMPKQKEYILVYKNEGQPKIRPIRIPREVWNEEYKEVLLGIEEDSLEELKELIDQEEASNEDVLTANALVKECRIQSLSSYFRDNKIPESERDKWRWDNAWRIVQAVGAGSLKERALKARTNSEVSAVLSARSKLSVFKTKFDHESRDPRIRLLFADKYLTYNPGDFWTDIKTTGGVGEEGGVYFPKGKKPEALIHRIISTSTNPGDLVLDSFAGSGTTGAVAQKMGRRWIMVELGEQAQTHILPRLKRVIDGEDKGGVTETMGWQGGGGYRFYKLAPSLLEADKWGRWVISKDYNAAMLAEAMCKHMGFTYAPSQDAAEYWRHGHSSECDFIYVTTLSLTQDQLRAISEDVGPERTLLICCKAFNARVDDFENLTVTKIPHAILSRCEWGKDDYSLQVADLPEREATPEPEPPPRSAGVTRRAGDGQPTLFDAGED
jgi:adenine-specific DNA-methyltransferase